MNIALYKPEIPPNTGNIGRICYCTDTPLSIIGEPAFSIDEATVKRAGLDYWEQLKLSLYKNWDEFHQKYKNKNRILLFTRFAKNCYADFKYEKEDFFIFGGESKGLPREVIETVETQYPEHLLRIPVTEKCRSLNLANCVSIVLYEALRQQNFLHLKKTF